MADERLAEHAEVFQCLADETRLEILQAILECYWDAGPVAFSEAMEAAGFDDSGHFSYHLAQLEEVLVWESNGKYLPTAAAHELLPSVLAGRLVDYDFDLDSPTVGSCLRCGQPLVAMFDYSFLVWCNGCENWAMFYTLAADVAAENDLRSLAIELDRTQRAHQATLQKGRCLRCGETTSVHIRRPESGPYASADLDVCFDVVCENCHEGIVALSTGSFLLGHPTVRAYCRDHGIDLFERPQWEYAWTQTDCGTEIRALDPWEIAAYATVDGCKLVAVIENDGSIEHIDHVRLKREPTHSPNSECEESSTVET